MESARILQWHWCMRYSIIKAGVNAIMVQAFNINDIANDVYQHNFGHRPHQGNIHILSAANMNSYRAYAWLLSPPCQPYTRQGLQKDSSDARASYFLKILELIPQTLQPPLILFVENVVGFETSNTYGKMVEILEKTHFVTQEFILSPLQFGVPYSRPRYFCLNDQVVRQTRESYIPGKDVSYCMFSGVRFEGYEKSLDLMFKTC